MPIRTYTGEQVKEMMGYSQWQFAKLLTSGAWRGIAFKPGINHWRFDADLFDAWIEAERAKYQEAC